MDPADDDRLMQPQEAADVEREDQVEQLAEEQREEDEAEADFAEEEATPEQKAAHYQDLLTLVHGIFGGADVDVQEIIDLSADEKAALQALKNAVRGSPEHDEGDMIYAEYRLSLLNQALAVLQPTLAVGLAPELAAMRDSYDALVDEVSALREHLERLDSAQEELFEQDKRRDKTDAAGADDTDDKPDDKPKPKPEDEIWAEVPQPGEPPRPSTLAGRPGDKPVEQPPKPSTVWDGKP